MPCTQKSKRKGCSSNHYFRRRCFFLGSIPKFENCANIFPLQKCFLFPPSQSYNWCWTSLQSPPYSSSPQVMTRPPYNQKAKVTKNQGNQVPSSIACIECYPSAMGILALPPMLTLPQNWALGSHHWGLLGIPRHRGRVGNGYGG